MPISSETIPDWFCPGLDQVYLKIKSYLWPTRNDEIMYGQTLIKCEMLTEIAKISK